MEMWKRCQCCQCSEQGACCCNDYPEPGEVPSSQGSPKILPKIRVSQSCAFPNDMVMLGGYKAKRTD